MSIFVFVGVGDLLIQLICNSVIVGSIYALISLGFTLVYKTVRFFHFAHGVVYTAGAYFAYSLSVFFCVPLFFAFFLASLLSAILGLAIDRLVYFPLRKNNAPPLVFLIASFGIFIFIQNFLQLIFGAQILTLRIGPIREGYHILSAVITPIQLLILAASLTTFALLWILTTKTKIGKAIIAVADDPYAASICGINPERVILYVFGIGSALAGMAGVLISLETNIEPTMGMNAILKGIVASIIGGIGSIPGALVGGFFLGIVENLGIWKIQAGWKDTIAFVVLILFLLLRPQGILGSRPNGDRL